MKSILEFIAGKALTIFIVGVASIFILIQASQNDELRKETEFQRQERQEKERFRAEMDALNKRDQYNSILDNPSLLGIEIFTEKYPKDTRVGILREISKEIKLEQRLNKLFSYIHKNQKPNVDSMLLFCELTDDSIQYDSVEEKLKKRFFELTSTKINYKNLVDFSNRFPAAHDEIKKLYRILEIVYVALLKTRQIIN